MEHVELEELYEGTYDRTVARSVQPDVFCSSAPWVVSAFRAFDRLQEPIVFREKDSFLVFCRGFSGRQSWWFPLEHMWMLGCPLVGPDPRLLMERLHQLWPPEVEAVVISGIRERSGLYYELLQSSAQGWWVVYQGHPTVRRVASLEGGLEGFLSRRSSSTRSRFRRTLKRFEQSGLELERPEFSLEGSEELFERLRAVEARSWKGLSGMGVDHGDMCEFYRFMLPRLGERGRLRLRFIRDRGRDVAYVLGGVMEGTYRGLQFSFDDEYRRESLGNVLQLMEIRELADEGVGFYDLGTDMGYKKRWAEESQATSTFILRRVYNG